MNNGQLLYCEHCKYSEKPQVLGRLMETGELLILRFHSGTSMLKAAAYELSCGCGFSYLIAAGSVQGTIMLKPEQI